MTDGTHLYWIESRPSENGRSTLVRKDDSGRIQDVTPAPWNVRSRVHEYGGGAYTVHQQVIYFSNFADNAVYVQKPFEEPQRLTYDEQHRYADFVVDASRHRLLCVREDHRNSSAEPQTCIVAIHPENPREDEILVSGNDFYSTPRISPDGTKLLWLTWNHPNMPWDGTELWMSELSSEGHLITPRKLAGGPNESIFQPEWSPDGRIYYISDRNNWWNLYRHSESGQPLPITSLEAECGLPQWVFGMRTYSFLDEKRFILTYIKNGLSALVIGDVQTRSLTPVELPYTVYDDPVAVGNKVWFLGASASVPGSIFEYEVDLFSLQLIKTSVRRLVDPGYLAQPVPFDFPTTGGVIAHALFYAPTNRDYEASPDEQPPLLVLSHGGPTSATSTSLNLHIQFWTSRGFAVVDVNYGGSMGYGRDYRNRLRGNWGVVDVDDCTNAALFAVEQGLADVKRLAIMGESAGGYTTLAALTFKQVFAVGASYYGISNLELLTKDTHKFESRYLDALIGPYPESKQEYITRSPIHSLDKLTCPTIFFQGLDDLVVPPNQAEMMVQALRVRGICVAYVPYEGEGHGFRKAENIRKSLEHQLYFFSQILGFDLPEDVEPLEIYNQ